MIRVLKGSLARAGEEAILRPVNSELLATTAAGREVDRMAGDELEERLRRFGSLPLGGALVTPGGELGVSFLIHVVVQSAEEPVTETGVRRALLNGLRRASEWDVDSLALPPVGTGAGNLDPEAAARIMIPLIREHADEHGRPRDIVIFVENDYEEEAFRREAERAAAPGGRAREADSRPEARR